MLKCSIANTKEIIIYILCSISLSNALSTKRYLVAHVINMFGKSHHVTQFWPIKL